MALSTKGKFVLGMAATGAYTGDILEDPVSGILGATVLGVTGAAMKFTDANIKEKSKVINSFNLDINTINKNRGQGYTSSELKDLQNLKSKWQGIERKYSVQDSLNTRLNDLRQDLLNPSLDKKQKIKIEKSISRIEGRLSKLSLESKDNFSKSIADKLKVFNTTIDPTFEGLSNYISGITDPRKASLVRTLLDGATPHSSASIQESLSEIKNKKAVISLKGNKSHEKLSNYFIKHLGNSPQDAELKARLILERSIGDNITIKDHNLIYTDKFKGSSEVIPLTAQTKNGTFYHSPNSGTYFAVAGVNPYADAYATGQKINMLDGSGVRVPTFEDATKRMHPELLALQLYEGKDISKGIDFVNSQMRFSGDESENQLIRNSNQLSEKDMTQKFKAVGNSLNLEYTLNTDVTGKIDQENPLRPLAKISTQGGTSSELKAVMTAYQQGFLENSDNASGMFNNISINNLTTISNTSFQPLAPMGMNQRGTTSVGIRDTTPLNRTDLFNQYESIFGKSFNKQFESSNVFGKLDILDKQSFNKAVASIFGNDYALSDGAGLFNLNKSDDFTHGLNEKLTITPQRGGNLLIKDSRINEILTLHSSLKESGSQYAKGIIDEDFIDNYKRYKAILAANQKQIKATGTGYLPSHFSTSFTDVMKAYDQGYISEDIVKANMRDIKLNPGSILGFNGDGSAVKLHKQYSQGVLKGLMMTPEGSLIVHTGASFNPRGEKIVKLFSEASKSNLYGINNFKSAAVLGALVNYNQVSFKGDTPFINVGGKSVQLTEDVLNRYYGAISHKIAKGESLTQIERAVQQAAKSHIILASEDTASGDFINIAKATSKEDILKLLSESKKAKLSENTLNYVNKVIGDSTDVNVAKRAALSAHMISNYKGATDVVGTVVSDVFRNFDDVVSGNNTRAQYEAVENMLNKFKAGVSIQDLQSDSKKAESVKNRLASTVKNSLALENLTDANKKENTFVKLNNLLTGLTDSNFAAYSTGLINTTGALNKGQAVLGIGNNARLSWTAYHQLLQSGFTKEELSVFGKSDFNSLYELEGILGERNNSFGRKALNNSINNQLNKDNIIDFERVLARTDPENRIQALSKLGINIDNKNQYITYKLNNSFRDLDKLNFSTLSTNRSGFFSKDDMKMLKQLEAQKLKLFRLDQQLTNANSVDKVKIKEEFEKQAKEYIKLTENSLRGDNSLVKNVASLRTSQSNISLARAITGNAEKYIGDQLKAGKIPDGVFISQEGLDYRLKKMGIKDYEFVDTAYDNIKKVRYKVDGEWVDLRSLTTREPSQGPLSSTYETLLVDTSLKNKGDYAHLYIPENQIAFLSGKYMDFDQDTIQELFPKVTKQQQEMLVSKFGNNSEALQKMIGLHKFLKVKGGDKAVKTALDFENFQDAVNFNNTAAIQGRERKALAPPSTALAVDMVEALGLEYGHTSEKSLKARFLTHTLVENLIKSAHIDTEEYGKQTESRIEALSRLRKDYVSGRINSDSYREQITPIIKKSLNLDKAETNIDLSPSDYNYLEESLNDLINAEVNQAKNVASRAKHPLHVTQGVGVGNMITRTIDSLSNFLPGLQPMLDIRSGDSIVKGFSEGKKYLTETLRNNKGVIGMGLGALLATSIMTRDGVEVEDNPSNDRLIRSTPSNLRPHNQVPSGIETNKTKSNYIVPKQHSKSIEIEGNYQQEDTSNMNYDISSAIFGDSLRQVRIE